HLLLRGGEQVMWLTPQPIAARDKSGLERIAAISDPARTGESAPPRIPITRHAHVILCSDFLMPTDEFEKLMQRYAALNLRGALLHIIDPAESALPFEGRVELKGCEGEA